MAEFPALAGLLVPGGESAGGPDSFPPEIEEEANNNFQVTSAASSLLDPDKPRSTLVARKPMCTQHAQRV